MDTDLLKQLVECALDDEDEESSSEAFRALQRTEPRTQLYELCESLLEGPESERDLATGLLIAFATETSPMRERALNHLYEILEVDSSSSVISGAILSLAHFQAARAVEKILSFHSHTDDDVRLSVAKSMARIASEGNWEFRPKLRAELVETMLALSYDSDASVRDWATFAFGNELSDEDSPEIRNALHDRLSDTEEDVREEAIRALAFRRDGSIVPIIEALLAEDNASGVILEAVDLLNAPSLNLLAAKLR